MEHNIQLSPTVVLIDAAFFNFVLKDMKPYFEARLHRTLPEISLADFISYLTLEATKTNEKKQVMVIFVYDNGSAKLTNCQPSNLRDELDGVGFENSIGEFVFSSAATENMTTRDMLFADLLKIVADSADVKEIIAIPHEDEYGAEVALQLNEVKEKTIVQFGMKKTSHHIKYRWEVLAFPFMEALGIHADEL